MQQIDTLPPYYATDSISLPADTVGDTLGCTSSYTCIYDSLFSFVEPAPPTLRKSLFTHHQLAVQNSHEITIQHQGSPGWFFGFIVLSIFLIGIYLHQKQLKIVTLLQSAIDTRALDRMLRDTNLTHAVDQAPIALMMLLPVSLVCYFFFFPHNISTGLDIGQYLLLLLACYAVYFTRNGIFRIVGNAFDNQESMHMYLSNNYIFHLLYTIVASAFAFFVFYTDNVGKIFFYILAGIIGFLFVIRLFRGMQIILTLSKSQKFYLFYYLCILEIVPIVFITKAIISY